MCFVIDHKIILFFVLLNDIFFCFHSFVKYWFMNLTSKIEMDDLMYFHIVLMYHKTLKFYSGRYLMHLFFGKYCHHFMCEKKYLGKKENNIAYIKFYNYDISSTAFCNFKESIVLIYAI